MPACIFYLNLISNPFGTIFFILSVSETFFSGRIGMSLAAFVHCAMGTIFVDAALGGFTVAGTRLAAALSTSSAMIGCVMR